MEPQLRELVEDLLTSHVFHCDICKKLLGGTAWLAEDNRSICDSCHESLKETLPNCLENSALSKVLQRVPVLCENRSWGCQALLKQSEYKEHVADCSYCPSTCLFPNCEWKGRKEDLMRHLGDGHRENFQRNVEKEAEFFVACKEAEDTISVLETLSGRFVARIRRAKQKVQVMILRHDICKGIKESFLLKYYAAFTKIVQYACSPVDSIADFRSFDSDHVTELNIDADIPTFVTLVYKLEDARSVIPEDILPFYQCADCKQAIKTAVYECYVDHQICQNCLDSRGHKCTSSVCRMNSPGVKESKLLNTLAQHYLFPCVYQKSGCSVNSPFNSGHESVCDYQSVKCPVSENCLFSNHHSKLLAHLKESHKIVNVVEKDSGSFVHNISASTQCFFFVDNNIFNIKYTDPPLFTEVGTLSWTCEKIVKEKDVEFLIKVDVYSKGSTKSLSIVECATKAISIPSKFVENFMQNGPARMCRVRLIKKPNPTSI